MDNMLTIGASKEAIHEAGEVITKILDAGVSGKTMRAALKALKDVCQVDNTTISGCSFSNHAGDGQEIP